MKILVITQQDIDIQVGYLEAQLKEEVKVNSVSSDGVSIFRCGTPLPQTSDWDWVALIGTCTAEINVPIDVELSAEEDPIGNLISAVMAVKEGMDTDEAIGEV